LKLPFADRAEISDAKLRNYLLSPSHPDGGGKAAFFLRHGFTTDALEVFRAALMQHAAENDVSYTEPSPFGTRYVIDGILHAPGGKQLWIRVVWFVDMGGNVSRLVTAYPLKRKKHD
jgi:hypothetical protein